VVDEESEEKAMANRKNQSLFERVEELEKLLPAERKRLTDMEEAHKRAHKAQLEKIATMEQKLAAGRDQLLRELFLRENVGEYGILEAFRLFGCVPPEPEDNNAASARQVDAAGKEKV
jgi:hypothetical protein